MYKKCKKHILKLTGGERWQILILQKKLWHKA